MTEVKVMTAKQVCIASAMKAGHSRKEAKEACMDCDNKIKKSYTVSSDGSVWETGSLDKPKLTVSAGQEYTVRFLGKGHDIEQLFIKEQVKLGDTREHAEQLSHGIMSFAEDKLVVDKDGNETVETIFFYSHDSTGKKEFNEIEEPVKKETSAFDRCVELRKTFSDTPLDAEKYSALIMFGRNPSPTTLKLRKALTANADFFALVKLMSDWHLERLKIEVAQIERDRAKNRKRVTVGSLHNRPKSEQNARFKHPFNNSHRLTVGDLYKQKRGDEE